MPSLELKVPPLAVVIVFGGAMLLASLALPVLAIESPARGFMAVLCVLAGTGAVVSGVFALRRHRTTVNPLTPEAASEVVQSGVYRFSRNPIYLGLLLWLLGLAAYLGSVVALLLLPGFVVYMNRYQIVPEERALLAKFGAPYARYIAAVRKWV